MLRKSMQLDIEPRVLIWARESIGKKIQEVAKSLGVIEDTVSKWESGQKRPTLTQIEKLTKIYKRPLAIFFLPEPPKEPPPPKDFRMLPVEQRLPFSSKTRLAIRRARRLQFLATDLAKSLNRVIVPQIGGATLLDNPEAIAGRLREQFGISIQTQFDWRDVDEALNEWKKTIEKYGIFVFQFYMPLEETRGFSLTGGQFPAIVLNLRDAITGRIFSLFHEYGHLLLNESGICDMEDHNHFSDDVEKFCNHFAGAFLVPRNDLLNHELVRTVKLPTKPSDEILGELAKEFKVSQEVILRRLVILGRATRNFYKTKHEEWKVKEEQRQKRGRKNPPRRCIQENGVPFVSLVLETYSEEKITYRDVADYLAIRPKYLPKVEELIMR